MRCSRPPCAAPGQVHTRTNHRRRDRGSRFGRTPGKYAPPEAPLRSYRVARHARRMAAHAAADYALVRTPPDVHPHIRHPRTASGAASRVAASRDVTSAYSGSGDGCACTAVRVGRRGACFATSGWECGAAGCEGDVGCAGTGVEHRPRSALLARDAPAHVCTVHHSSRRACATSGWRIQLVQRVPREHSIATSSTRSPYDVLAPWESLQCAPTQDPRRDAPDGVRVCRLSQVDCEDSECDGQCDGDGGALQRHSRRGSFSPPQSPSLANTGGQEPPLRDDACTTYCFGLL
jgi:hypothetical protein